MVMSPLYLQSWHTSVSVLQLHIRELDQQTQVCAPPGLHRPTMHTIFYKVLGKLVPLSNRLRWGSCSHSHSVSLQSAVSSTPFTGRRISYTTGIQA